MGRWDRGDLCVWGVASAVVGLFACHDQINPTFPPEEPAPTGSASASPGGPGAPGGPGSPGNPSMTTPAGMALATGSTVLVGVTTDGQAVYIDGGKLLAIDTGGGTPTTIDGAFAATDIARVVGGGVGFWKGVTAGIGTFNVWTKASGAKTSVTPQSTAGGVFAASADGARIAFSVGALQTATNLAVTSSASPDASAFLFGSYTIDLSSAAGATPSCPATFSFLGTSLVASYCTGTSATASSAHLVSVPEGATTLTSVIDADSTSGIQPFFAADSAGDKLFVIGTAAGSPADQGRIVSVGATMSVAPFDTDVQDGFMLADGTVVYRTSTALKRLDKGDAAAAPTTLVASGVKRLVALSGDGTHVLFRSGDPSSSGLVDLQAADTTTASQTAKAVVATAAAEPGAILAGTLALYLDASGNLHGTPLGGADGQLATGVTSLSAIPGTSKALVFMNARKAQTGEELVDVSIVDGAAAKPAATPLTIGVVSGAFRLESSKLVYASLAATAPGLYAVAIP
jgi:hypothetical protein